MPDQATVVAETPYGEIEDVNTTTRQFFYSRLNVFLIALAIILGILASLYSYITYTYTSDARTESFYFPFTVIAIILLRYGYLKYNVTESYVKQIAAEMGYTYEEIAPLDSVSGDTFLQGNSQEITHIFSGTQDGYSVRIFEFTYVEGAGKTRRDYTNTIYELDCREKLPHILLNPYYGIIASTMEKVELEGNFSNDFTLYVQKGEQIEVRELFTPDVMLQFVEHFKGYKFETFGTKLYVVDEDNISYNRKEFMRLRDAALALFDVVLPGLREIGQDLPTTA
jgi:hypothetical protein